jgi:hypothetical protein
MMKLLISAILIFYSFAMFAQVRGGETYAWVAGVGSLIILGLLWM